MKCKYCKNPCTHLAPVYYDGGGLAHKRFTCDKCPIRIEFYVNPDGTMNDIRFLWEEDHKRYRVFCNFPHNACLIQYQVYRSEWSTAEIDLDYIPDWDPKTIEQKIKTYITFL